jgi:ATP-binding cassette, subfamily B, bacterial PglK
VPVGNTWSASPAKALVVILSHLSTRRRRELAVVVFLMFVSAVCEVATIGAVLPFLAFLSAPEQALAQPWFVRLVGLIGLGSTPDDLALHLTLVFGAAAIAAGTARIAVIYSIAKLNAAIGHELAGDIFWRSINQPYEIQVYRNSSEVIGGLQKLEEVVWVLFSLLNVTSGLLLAVSITTALLAVEPVLTLGILIGLGGLYAGIVRLSRHRLQRNSVHLSRSYNVRIKYVQEALGAIRDVLLGHTQEVFARQFDAQDRSFREAQASNSFLGAAPRFGTEAVGMVVIAALGYWLSRIQGNVASGLPTLGALALGLQRMMPAIQQLYNGIVAVRGRSRTLEDVAALLQQPLPTHETNNLPSLPFSTAISMEGVWFTYGPQKQPALADLTLTIRKGMRIGLIGRSGSGKSTMADLIMGLLQPTRGRILVDGVPITGACRSAWQRNIAHVPQSIFLSDGSFAENIAFGVSMDNIDYQRVRNSARNAQIADFIERQPDGYATLVGERGLRISGGQRQRLALARALYKGASVLVFDEATSALDDDTETAVMQAIGSLGTDLTIIMIAHRLQSLRACDLVFRLENGAVVQSGTYDELIGPAGAVKEGKVVRVPFTGTTEGLPFELN